MDDLTKPKDCCVPKHEFITLRTAAMLNKIDPAGAYDSTNDFMEYSPEVPYFVDMILTYEISTDRVRQIMDKFFSPGWILDSAIADLVDESWRIRKDWDHQINRDLRRNARWDALRVAFARTFLQQCDIAPWCTCPSCASYWELKPHLGIMINEETNQHTFIDFDSASSFTLPNSSRRRDVMGFLEGLREFKCFKNDNILQGFLEVPRVIGELLHEGPWGDRLAAIEHLEHTDYFRNATIEGFVLALAEVCFTDEYLDEVSYRQGIEV